MEGMIYRIPEIMKALPDDYQLFGKYKLDKTLMGFLQNIFPQLTSLRPKTTSWNKSVRNIQNTFNQILQFEFVNSFVLYVLSLQWFHCPMRLIATTLMGEADSHIAKRMFD